MVKALFIAYHRVSTDRQGASSLGLEAQPAAVLRHIEAGQLTSEYTEVESGEKHTNRPQLLAAFRECRRNKATLVIAKLDRLWRSVASISAYRKRLSSPAQIPSHSCVPRPLRHPAFLVPVIPWYAAQSRNALIN